MFPSPTADVQPAPTVPPRPTRLPAELEVETHYDVPEALTARHWFETLPHGAAYAHRLMPVLATGAMVAVAEAVCAQALQAYLAPGETVVGTRVEIRHVGAARAGTRLRLRARLVEAEPGGRAARFAVDAWALDREVCTVDVAFRVVDSGRFAARLAGRQH